MEENFLLNYDPETGDIKGFYLRSIHGDNIPQPYIEITPEKHDFYIGNNGLYKLDPITLEDMLKPAQDPGQLGIDPVEDLKKQLKEANDRIAEQTGRLKQMEEDSLAFQDFVLSTIGGV